MKPETNFVNLTPHPIHLYRIGYKNWSSEKQILAVFPKEKNFYVRANEQDIEVTKVWIDIKNLMDASWDWTDEIGNYSANVPIIKRKYSTIDLPKPVPGIIYIVSLPILMLLGDSSDRTDLVAPDTGPGIFGAVRNQNGDILGVQRFITLKTFSHGGNTAGGPWPYELWEKANKKEIEKSNK